MYSLIRIKLLAPCLLVCFACLPQLHAAPAAPDVSPAPDGCYPGFNTAEGCQALQLNTGVANTALGWRSLFANTAGGFNTGAGAGTLLLNQGDANTAVGTAALLLNSLGGETQLLERPRCSIPQAILTARDRSTALTAPLRSMLTKPDSVTMLLAIPRCLEISMAPRIQLLVILPWRIVTQLVTATRTSTVLLALRRCREIITATQTTLLAFPPWEKTSTVCSIRPWALSLFSVIALALQTSPLVTRLRSNNGSGSFNTVIGDLAGAGLERRHRQHLYRCNRRQRCRATKAGLSASATLDSSMPALSAASRVWP